MKLYFAGGAGEIGGSCIYIRIGGYGVLMDAGIRQGGTVSPLPDFRGIQERGGVDLILVSHAHTDHTGALPVISKAYPAARIYMTKMAMDQTRVLLLDSLKLMERKEEEIPQYSAEDVSAMMERIVTIPYQKEVLIRELSMKLTAYPAGHIAGAACLYLQTEEGSVFYSGDVSGFAQQTIEGIGIPRLRPDVAIMESTYGDRLHASRALEEKRLTDTAADCIRRGMKILIPAFALGRAQEVLLLLRKAMNSGTIPRVPVYVDGMVRDMNRVYTANPTFLRGNLARRIFGGEEPFYNDDIRPVGRMEDREQLTELPGPAIFVASSGMLSGGPSVTYARKLLPRKDACVILTGYQDEEAPGRMLMNLLEEGSAAGKPDSMAGRPGNPAEKTACQASGTEERRVTLGNISVSVCARIVMVGLSAHADQSELCGIVERMTARRVILVHGNTDAISALGKALSSDVRRRVYQPSEGEEIEIVPGNSRRQQTAEELAFCMNCRQFDERDGAYRLWDFVRLHYPGRAFTAEKLAEIWYGVSCGLTEEELQKFQNVLLESLYFARHPRRLYLLMPESEESIRKNRQKGQATPQDVERKVRELIAGLPGDPIPIRKLGYYIDERRVVLTTPFPDAVPAESVGEVSEALKASCGWTLEMKNAMNHQGADTLLRMLFPSRVRKISYYEQLKVYQIVLKEPASGDLEGAETFRKKTGWRLRIEGLPETPAGGAASNISGECAPAFALDTGSLTVVPNMVDAAAGGAASSLNDSDIELSDGWFRPVPGTERVEQNLAFSIIEQCFEEQEIRPYKKGRKSDNIGVFLEMSFLSPALGLRCAGVLAEAARQTGWRIHISESVNQNALSAIAAELCGEYGVELLKNPSYLPVEGRLRITVSPDTPVPDAMREKFLARTGVRMV